MFIVQIESDTMLGGRKEFKTEAAAIRFARQELSEMPAGQAAIIDSDSLTILFYIICEHGGEPYPEGGSIEKAKELAAA